MIRRGRPPRTEQTYKTNIVTRETNGVTVNAFYKNSRIKQYLKEGRALRVETVINKPDDIGCLRRLQHLDEVQVKGRAINNRLLDTERVGQGCVLASPAFERVAQSSVTDDGRRSPAQLFGNPRVMALLGALCFALNSLGFTNPEPPRPGEPAARSPARHLHPQPDELRPRPTPTQRPHPTMTQDQHPTTSPATASASRSSTPSPQPTPRPNDRRRRTTSTHSDTPCPRHHRATRHEPNQPDTTQRSPKTQDNHDCLATEDRESWMPTLSPTRAPSPRHEARERPRSRCRAWLLSPLEIPPGLR